MNKFVLIDAQALIHRSYHALPPLTTPKGEPANAVFGFATVFLKMMRDLAPTHLAACFDLPGPTFRHEEYEKYKAHRPKAPDELARQIGTVKRMLDVFGVPVFEQPGFEADDLLATLIKQIKSEQPSPGRATIIIVTGDLDMLQLVDDQVVVYTLRRGMQDTVLYDVSGVAERYGLRPDQLADLRGLRGDSSDNIPGVPGIGEKTASALLQEFGTLEGIYEVIERGVKRPQDSPAGAKRTALTPKMAEKLAANKEQAFFSKYLATIRDDAPVTMDVALLRWKGFDRPRAQEFFQEMGFRSLINRLPKDSGEHPGSGVSGSAQGRFAFKEEDGAPEKTAGEGGVKRPQGRSGGAQHGEKDIAAVIEERYQAGIFSKRIYDLEMALIPIIAGDGAARHSN